MPLPQYSPRAGEIGDAEQAFGLATLDPSKAGAAFPLMIGAQAARQDAFSQYNKNNEYDQALAAMIQQQTNAHNIRSDRNTSLALTNPGALGIAAMSPDSGIDLGNPLINQLVNAQTDLSIRGKQADIAKDVGQAGYSGVQSGYRIPIGQYAGMAGFTPEMHAPEAETLEGMRQAGANARAGAAAQQASATKYGVTFDPTTNRVVTTLSNVDPSQHAQAQADAVVLNRNQPSTFMQGDTTYATPNSAITPQALGVTRDRKTKMVTGVIPPYQGKGTTGGTQNSSAPPADAIKTVVIPAAQQQELARAYVASKGNLAGSQAAQVAADSQRIRVAETPDGRRVVVLDGKILGTVRK